ANWQAKNFETTVPDELIENIGFCSGYYECEVNEETGRGKLIGPSLTDECDLLDKRWFDITEIEAVDGDVYKIDCSTIQVGPDGTTDRCALTKEQMKDFSEHDRDYYLRVLGYICKSRCLSQYLRRS
ncbi:MAG: hypothetical protein ACTSPB_19215, partial [Candidatus Thorarchaeota archaeon]